MADDSPGTTAQYEATYRGARDAVLSVFSGVMWAVPGVFGIGLLYTTAIAGPTR